MLNIATDRELDGDFVQSDMGEGIFIVMMLFVVCCLLFVVHCLFNHVILDKILSLSLSSHTLLLPPKKKKINKINKNKRCPFPPRKL